MLKRIEISNFKAIQDRDGESRPLILSDLAPINYLIGPNGSGKSSILSLVSHFHNQPGSINFLTYRTQAKVILDDGSLIDLQYDEAAINKFRVSIS